MPSHACRSLRGRQRGMAVIVAMLVVAIVAVMAAALLTRQAAALRTLRSEQLRAQVDMAVDAALEQAGVQLREDARGQLATVLQGRWAQPLQLQAPLPVRLQLVDAQGLFNLRNLLKDGRPDGAAGQAFQQLCNAQGLAPGECGQAQAFLQARLRDGERAALAPLPREEALALALPGSDPAAVLALARRTVVLPAHTLINANTSDVSLLQASAAGIAPARVKALLDERDQGRWFANRGDIANRLRLTDLQMERVPWGIHSEWFLAVGEVQADARRVDFRALIWREYRDDEVRVQRVWTRVGA
ncbi:type II secretion system minor pseudopilin GspK [Stenotrophomonas sp. 24(2023)]|uniref:type II secretion system minor pseudopilin GspK n=1 Tax=Stenotrophomonas sp. 24(2023) TaxID=3068324 RepID=UPI0027E1116F|nr:type II secretion system minor pseudopilin GspK [Stenotrophomonas sp. 24(2023)]WMJ69403.1 type II secretion system minor pseudopilin GspK [Stenotrophomonas sp. 24(2023)]